MANQDQWRNGKLLIASRGCSKTICRLGTKLPRITDSDDGLTTSDDRKACIYR